MNWPRTSRGLPLGGAGELDLKKAAESGRAWFAEAFAPRQSSEPQAVRPASATYAQLCNQALQEPTQPGQGVQTAVGRIFAEARTVTTASNNAVTVVLSATQNGCEATVQADETILGGQIVFWRWNDRIAAWAPTPLAVTLPTGWETASTGDQFLLLGGK